MKRAKKFIIKILGSPLFWIFIIALFIRTYKLAEFPVGFHVDEVKVGWNALSILKTAHDDKGGLFSLYYNSFGDYRPTGIFYFTIPGIIAFGRDVFAVRFPTAIFGALTVFPIYLLANLLDKKNKFKIWKLNSGHLAAVLLSISPWHIEVSRATGEFVISAFFALFATYFYIKHLESAKIKFAIFSAISVLLAYFLYHSIRLLGPFFYVIPTIFYFKEYKKLKFKKFAVACTIIPILLTVILSAGQAGLQRFGQVSIFKDESVLYEIGRIRSDDHSKNILTIIFDNKWTVYGRHAVSEYGKYFSSDFLLGYFAKPFRYTTPGAGLVGYVEIILVVGGVVQILRGKKSALPLILLLLAPIPAALTTEDSPNLARAFFMLPFLIILEAFGFGLIGEVKKKFRIKAALAIFFLLIANFSLFEYMYFFHSESHMPFIKNLPLDSSSKRNVGVTDLVNYLDKNSSRFEKIVVTNFPDSPYVWYAFLTGKDPGEFNKSRIADTNERIYKNVVFSEDRCPSDSSFQKYAEKNILIIDPASGLSNFFGKKCRRNFNDKLDRVRNRLYYMAGLRF